MPVSGFVSGVVAMSPSFITLAPSNQIPLSEATTATGGALTMASAADHQHPRLSSSSRATLDGSGLATVTYTRSFSAKPAITLTAINPSGRPVLLEVQSDVTDGGGNYIGCVVHGYRNQNLPAVLTLLSALINFDVFGASAAGVEVNVIAIQASTP